MFYFSFWTDDWATVLSLLKKKGVIDKFISRVHGYDLYKERWPDHIIPFRNFQLKQVNKIVAVSKDGFRYLTEQFPKYQHKFCLSHLGIFDHGEGTFSDSNVFTIVSCSNLIPLKRVHLLAEAILGMDSEVKWIHFGDGPEKENIERIVKKMPVSIQVELKGNVPNEEIIRYYQQHSVNIFVQLSETEGGVPLALQEAASFGIPLLGTDAGGIPEIVNEETGLLINKDVQPEQLTILLKKIKNSNYNSTVFRKGVRTFWLRFFDAYSNYSEFAESILKDKET